MVDPPLRNPAVHHPTRTLPDGSPAPIVAPDEVLFDEADLLQMRRALRDGHSVAIGADGNVYTSAEPVGPPMTDATETFIESRLGELRHLARHGFGVSIKPDGQIMAQSHNQKYTAHMEPDASLDAQDLDLIRGSVRAGADVGVRADGTIQVVYGPHGQPIRYKDDLDNVMRAFEQELASGAVAQHASEGRGVIIEHRPEGGWGISYHDPGTPPPGFEFPEDPKVPLPPRDPTAAELAAEARRVDLLADDVGAGARREYEARYLATADERDDAARRKWSLEQEAAAADRQVLREETALRQLQERIAAEEARADRLYEAGQHDAADDVIEQVAATLRTQAAISRRRADLAEEEAVRLRSEAATTSRRVQELDQALLDIDARFAATIDAGDALEAKAAILQEGADALRGAEEQEQLAAKRRAAGDTSGADQATAEAARLRSVAEGSRIQADAVVVDQVLVDDAITPDGPAPAPAAPSTGTDVDGTPSGDAAAPAPMRPVRANPGVVVIEPVESGEELAAVELPADPAAVELPADPAAAELSADPAAAELSADPAAAALSADPAAVELPADPAAVELPADPAADDVLGAVLVGESADESPIDAAAPPPAVEPPPPVVEAEPVVVEAEPVVVEAEPVFVEPEPVVAEAEPFVDDVVAVADPDPLDT